MKLTHIQKLEFVTEVLDGIPMNRCCKKFDISRTLGYRFLERFTNEGPDGLLDRSSAPNSVPSKKSEGDEEEIINLALNHPDKGCLWYSATIKKKQKIKISPPTVQRILSERNLEKRQKRLVYLLKKYKEEKTLSDESLSGMGKINQHFKWRQLLSEIPGSQMLIFRENGKISGSRKNIEFYFFLDTCGMVITCVIRHFEFWPKPVRKLLIDYKFNDRDDGFSRHRYSFPIITLNTLLKTRFSINVKEIICPGLQPFEENPVIEQIAPNKIKITPIPYQANQIPFILDFQHVFKSDYKNKILTNIEYKKPRLFCHTVLIEDSLNDFLIKYNSRIIHTFPHFGKTPLDMSVYNRKDIHPKKYVTSITFHYIVYT